MDALDSILKIEERLVTKATIAKIPIGGTIELTPLCNMNCDMCFIRLNKSEMDQVGKMRSVEEWLEIALEMKKAGTLFVLLTGGEPFLYPNFVDLYKGLRKLGMIITINTNGTLVTKEIAQALGEDKPRRVNITLYGASNETYAKLCHNPKGFDQTIAGIELLLKHHIDIKLNGSIVPENKDEIQQLQAIADHYGLYMKMDTYMYPSSRERFKPFNQQARLDPKTAAIKSIEIKQLQKSKEDFNNYKHYMLQHCQQHHTNENNQLNCRAGTSAYWLTWYGHMTPCIFMKQPSIDVFENGFDASWKYIVQETQKIHLPQACVSCEKRDICQVCGASAALEGGKKPEYMCAYITHILEHLKEMED